MSENTRATTCPRCGYANRGGGKCSFCGYEFGRNDQLEEEAIYGFPWVLEKFDLMGG